MKEILTDKMLHEIFEALQRGETYGYSDGNTSVQVTPNSISIQYNSMPAVRTNVAASNKDKEITEFLNFCDSINDDLFVEVCETFSNDELYNLQTALDTDNYKNTIKVFSTRVGEVAHSRLTEICNDADAEIRHQEEVIRNAQAIIEDIHKELDKAHAKYAL
jgi:hypothetical protein